MRIVNMNRFPFVSKSQELIVIRNLCELPLGKIAASLCDRIALVLLGAGLLAASVDAQDVLTWHYDNARSGVQQNETILTSSNVKASTFGKVFSFPIAGDALAQPLYLTQYPMSDGRLHNVLIVATEEDYVYAFDADGHNPATGYLWRRSMLPAGETWVSYTDVHVVDIKPNVGITGTPVIDRAGGTIYLVAKSKTTSGSITFHQRLHALDIADGSEKLNGPTNITATVPGSGDGGSAVTFDALLGNQRASLLLAPTPSGKSGSSVFVAWASHGDLGKYHGWVMAYNASDISKQTGAWCVTPNGAQGGIWMSGGGISSDNLGNIFLAVGNGTFDAYSGGKDWGDTALRFNLNGFGLAVEDSFTPENQHSLDVADNDMGTGAMVLLPAQGGSIPHLAVTNDKSGTIYLINRDKMGGYLTARDSSVQDFGDGGYPIHSSFAFFNNSLYMAPDGGPLEAWAFNPTPALFSTSAYSKSDINYGCKGCDPTGSTPSVSANGASNGIVWALDNSNYYVDPAVLHAYAAGNLEDELYNSNQAGNRDKPALATKFTTPTIASGRVYVGGRNAVTVYGLLGTAPQSTVTPQFSLPAGTYSGPQTVTITDSMPNAAIYYTYNGTTPTTRSTRYTTGIYVENSETLKALAVAPGLSASAVASAAYTIGITTPPPNQVEVPLGSEANLIGIFSDGTKFTNGGLNTAGSAYSSNLLGSSLTYGGAKYIIGAANQKNVVKGTSPPVIKLTAGNYSALKLLGVAVIGNQGTPQVFTVTYSDGTTQKFFQDISDWVTPQHYAGESIALSMPYSDASGGGKTAGTYYLYQYSFTLNSAKTVASLTMPSNPEVIVVAVTLIK